MMTIKDYAQDVELEIEEIEALCDKIGIEYQDENTDLDETSIILLDNAVAEKDNEEEIIEDEEVEELEDDVPAFSLVLGVGVVATVFVVFGEQFTNTKRDRDIKDIEIIFRMVYIFC